MKIKQEYILQQIADQWLVIDTNANSVNFNNILGLNASGRLLWQQLAQGAELPGLAAALQQQFGIDRDEACADAGQFMERLRELGCLQDENEN